MTELEKLQADIREIAGYVQTLAKAVLTKNGEYEDEENAGGFPPVDEVPADPVDDILGGGVNDDVPSIMDDEEEYDDFQAAYKAIKALQVLKDKRTQKGYASAARVNSDEHDAPFGEKDSDLKGNEAQPAGKQGGAREDETFGSGSTAVVSKMQKQLADMAAQLKELGGGVVVAKAATVPSTGNAESSAKAGSPEGNPDVMTREMQEQYKALSFRQINKIREEVGDLPRHLIGTL